MDISDHLKVDWLHWLDDPADIKAALNDYKLQYGLKGPACLPSYRKLTGRSEFLVPGYVSWRKIVDAIDLLDSKTISDKRKKLIRKAIAKSEHLGVSYRIVSPVAREDFDRFLTYYKDFCHKLGYDEKLHQSFFQQRLPEHLYLIEVWYGEEYLGGRLVCRYKNNLSTDFRAIARTREVKEGYDIVCEKLYFDLAAKLGVKLLGRGKELNLRGIAGKRIGMLWNKLKYGYKPVVPCYFPRFYSDYGFLKDLKFDLFFFVSIENDEALWGGGEEVLNLNFVCGDNPSWDDIKSVKEKSPYPVKIWDGDFNELVA